MLVISLLSCVTPMHIYTFKIELIYKNKKELHQNGISK